MERNISYQIYVVAFIFSIFTFIIGIFFGNFVGRTNLNLISEDLSSTSARVESIQVLLLLDNSSPSFCPLYLSELSSVDVEVEKLGHKLSYLEDVRKVYDDDLKRKYFVLEAQSYLLSKKIKQVCEDKSVLLINFYSNKNCPTCKKQGDEILRAKDELKAKNIPVKLFSFDGEIGSPIASAFKNQYGISSYPSLAINGRTYDGSRNSSEISSIVLRAYNDDRS